MLHTFRPRQIDYARKMNEYLKNKNPEELMNLDGPGTESLAAWFLGPKAENQDLFSGLIEQAIQANCSDRKNYFPNDPKYVTEERKGSGI